jgi:hypothetical protein
MLEYKTTTNPELMPPNNSSKHIPSSGISHLITLISNGIKHEGPLPRFISDYGLGDNKVCQA